MLIQRNLRLIWWFPVRRDADCLLRKMDAGAPGTAPAFRATAVRKGRGPGWVLLLFQKAVFKFQTALVLGSHRLRLSHTTRPGCKGHWEMELFSWEATHTGTKQSSLCQREVNTGRPLELFDRWYVSYCN